MPLLAPGENKKVVAIVVAMCLVAWYRERPLRWGFYDETGRRIGGGSTPSPDRRDAEVTPHQSGRFGSPTKSETSKKQASETATARSWRHHEIVSYLLENASFYSVPLVSFYLFPNVDRSSAWKLYLTFILRSTITVNSILLLHKISADYVYDDVNYFFTKKKPSSKLSTIIMDYIQCNFVDDLMSSSLQTLLITSLKEVAFKKFTERPKIKVIPFLMKAFLARIIVDVGFYLVHRALHSDLLYTTLHKRHHQHKEPRLQTNFHFTPVDLFMEAAVPLFLVEGVFRGLGIPSTRWEQEIIFMHHVWYEAGSHTGKEIPTVTWFPELSPLVDWFFDCDTKLVFYHTAHHRLFNCNYSISPWPDRLLGSYRIDTPTETQEEALAALGKRDEEEEEEEQ